jgi:cation diffusion facilitator family transporter
VRTKNPPRASREIQPISEGSRRVVYAALAGNLFTAISKFVAATISGSSAMLTEAIHSTADCANQMLLLVGVRRARRASDESHPFGYGLEIYFWTFVVAVLVLLGGGTFSIVQGLEELSRPSPIRWPGLSLLVLVISAGLDGASFRFAYREYRTVEARHRRPGRPVGLIQFIRWSKDPSLYESLLEDGTALAGLAVAFVGIVLAAYFGIAEADGIASVIIGFILMGNGSAILLATRSLIAGEGVAPPVLEELWAAVRSQDPTGRVTDVASLHLGPNRILIAITLTRDSQGPETDFLSGLEHGLKSTDPRVRDVLFRYSSRYVAPPRP